MTAKAKGKPTIKDVAKLADVSIATVSRIINNKDQVSGETRRRVLEAIHSLNYRPMSNVSERDSRRKSILLCVSELVNPFNSAVIEGIQEAAFVSGYNVLIMQVKDTLFSYKECGSVLDSHNMSGVILLTSVSDYSFVEEMSKLCPVVMCSEYYEGGNVSFVSIDDISAARKATDHLISTGRKKIALLNSSLRNRYARHREQGYLQALQNASLPSNPNWIAHVPTVNYNLAMSHALYILGAEPQPDAFFATSDVYAISALKAAQKLGLRIPDDLSVVGFDNIELSSMTDPSITTIEQPSYQIGFQSFELLLERMESPDSKVKQIILDTELIVRESTVYG